MTGVVTDLKDRNDTSRVMLELRGRRGVYLKFATIVRDFAQLLVETESPLRAETTNWFLWRSVTVVHSQ